MLKAATKTLSVIFLLSLLPHASVWAQKTAAQAAEEEAIRREEAMIIMRQKLVNAETVLQSDQVGEASKLYEEAYALAVRIGTGVDAERQEAIQGIAATRLALAREANGDGDLRGALEHLNRLLKVDPGNDQANRMKARLELALEELRGLEPSEDMRNRVPQLQEKRIEVMQMVQDARVLLQLGELDEAEEKLREATKLDPTYYPATRYLDIVREAQYQVEKNKNSTQSKDMLVDIERAREIPDTRESLPVPNSFARTNLVHTGEGRTEIYSKLHRIVLNEVLFDSLPLSEVVRYLKEESRKRDPEGEGINFMINPFVDSSGFAAQPAVDPNTGAVIPPPPVEEVDLANVTIRINPALNEVRLADLLDAVIKVADQPIKFSVEDYAVVFSQKLPEAVQLFTRTYRVNPNTFVQGLEGVVGLPFGNIQTNQGGGGGGGFGGGGGGGIGGQGGVIGVPVPRVLFGSPATGGGGLGGGGGFGGGGGLGGAGGQGGFGISYVSITNETLVVQDTVRAFLGAAGVNLLPPNAVFFNDRTGYLLVRASLQELDIVEQAIQVLNAEPAQVNIKAKFVSISQADARALGFDWFLGTIAFGGGSGQDIGLSAGSAPSFSGAPTTTNPTGVFPGDGTTGVGVQAPSATDQMLSNGLRNTVGKEGINQIPAVGTITGLLTDPQFRVVIRALEQRDGVDFLSEPEVTTQSGRQAQMTVNEIRTIVTGQNFNQTAGGAGAGTGGAAFGTQAAGGVATTSQFNTQPIPFGPALDVVPYVTADGYTIQMTIIPTFTEFLGYDDPGGFVPQAQSVTGNTVALPITAQLPLPRMRVRMVVTSVTVWDGQTVVLGGLIGEETANRKDKIPLLGDLPWVGRLFRSESSETLRSNLVIFVTPTIIDPAGNRVNDVNDLPYNPNQTPPQQ